MFLFNVKLRIYLFLLLGCIAWNCQAQTPSRAIWIWEQESYDVLESTEKAQELITFFKHQGITTLYLYADAHAGRNLIISQSQLYERIIENLHTNGIQVHALLGSWPLHTERYILPENRLQALQMVQRVLDYNLKAALISRFDGINLDIEPHGMDDWSSRREEYLQMFLSLSEAWMSQKRQMNQSLQIGPAIAFWLDGIDVLYAGKIKPASQHLQDIYDHVVLMDYRDHAEGPDGILSHARDELDYGRKIGKRVWLGVETGPNEIRKVSFNHLSPAQMNRELGLVQQALSQEVAFAGFVIHHYGTYRLWLGQ